MKKYITKFVKIIFTVGIIIGFMKYEVNALPYYDLRFEEIDTKIVKGEYENLNGNINLEQDTKIPMVITKSYEPKININVNNDEKDAISQSLGSEWSELVVINKQEEISIKKHTDTYIQVRPLYKEIKGNLVQDYASWNKKKEVTILIPVDAEYTLKTK